MFDFHDQVVMITGAAGNLGSATAHAFQAAGARLVLVDKDEERLQHVFPELAESGEHIFVGLDLADAGAIEGMVYEVANHYGRIDVLVNIAGGYRAGSPLHETPLETWDFNMSLNARSIFFTGRAVIPHMLRQGSGKIVSVAARAALAGGANMSVYTASKAAVIRLTESMAAELKDKGINVNCILPGTIDTPQNRKATPTADFSRWVAPEALADVILFLASPHARAVHGAAIPVYGLS
ncbi:MAG: SDR family NAD(P)-dependent oxidoreductase [Chloroflexi bacterium]|nr:SDR family NAD(P)-dependent oxidoreductase [Chloroflexota bacterium]MCI0578452.1 SDR family NAD(P)-dependent oxidoreductase [Chloroflexota bacterium]MCI0643898.1 SDR family NAD(P)-dependent oxidoreductase [Chloroflexota bacterium]MCI0729192.1 SDR family NAD(P)-dependent oxidoreductase [Chloroflexota bacterium]